MVVVIDSAVPRSRYSYNAQIRKVTLANYIVSDYLTGYLISNVRLINRLGNICTVALLYIMKINSQCNTQTICIYKRGLEICNFTYRSKQSSIIIIIKIILVKRSHSFFATQPNSICKVSLHSPRRPIDRQRERESAWFSGGSLSGIDSLLLPPPPLVIS